jgi:Fe-S cluster assembly protein SufD
MQSVSTKKLEGFIQELPITAINFPASQLILAKKILDEKDFPTTHDESWKYTRVGKIAALEAKLCMTSLTESELKTYVLDETHHTIIFINGKFHALFPSTTESTEGLHIKLFSDCSEKELAGFKAMEDTEDVFDAMNMIYLNEGIWIKLDERCVMRQPVVVVHLLSGEQSVHQTRIRVELGKQSQLEIIQQYQVLDAENSFGNTKTEIQLEDGAVLKLHKIQHGIKGNFIISRESADQSASSILTIHTHTSDSRFVRNDSTIRVHGSNAETNLFGTYLLKGNEHVDNHTSIDHLAPHCVSNELYKGVIGGNATGVFNGKVIVRQDAQKISAFQSNANILTSDFASINSKPELEIYADDVKCSHGSTTGQLDDEAVFYLRARGISEKGAKDLLIQAFLDDVFSKTEIGIIKQILETTIASYFEKNGD